MSWIKTFGSCQFYICEINYFPFKNISFDREPWIVRVVQSKAHSSPQDIKCGQKCYLFLVKGTDPDSTFSLQKEKQEENKKILESGIKMVEWEDPELTSS